MQGIRIQLTERTTKKVHEVPLNQMLLINPRTIDEYGVEADPNKTTDAAYRLRFVNLPDLDQPDAISIEYTGIDVVYLDGEAVANHTPITSGSILEAGPHSYLIEIRTRSMAENSATVRAGWVTITGSVRPHNEDAIGIYQRAPIYAYIVADGVGGAYAGELISEFAVKSMLRTIHLIGTDPTQHRDWEVLLNDAIKQVNKEVRKFSQEASRRQGRRVQAGSTLTILLIDAGQGYIAHVGDSRIYRLRGGTMYQLTEDHSSVASDSTQGFGAPPQKRNVLLKGIGKGETIAPEAFSLDIEIGDRFVLCSDGASDRIGEGELEQWAKAYHVPKTLATYVAQEADRRESRDNISVIVADIIADPVTEEMPLPMERAYIGFPENWLPAIVTPPDALAVGETTIDDGPASIRSTRTMLAPTLPEKEAEVGLINRLINWLRGE